MFPFPITFHFISYSYDLPELFMRVVLHYLDSFATNRFPTRLSTAHIGESHCS